MPAGNGEGPRTYPLRVPPGETFRISSTAFSDARTACSPGRSSRPTSGVRLRGAGEDPRRIVIASQVHGTRVLPQSKTGAALRHGHSTTDDRASRPPTPLVSASADVILTIRTADCVPILLVAPRARAVAAVHAGWRGALARRDRRGHQRARRRATPPGPREIRAAIGPAIGPCCYEFGAEHLAEFRMRSAQGSSARGVRPRRRRPRATTPRRARQDRRPSSSAAVQDRLRHARIACISTFAWSRTSHWKRQACRRTRSRRSDRAPRTRPTSCTPIAATAPTPAAS